MLAIWLFSHSVEDMVWHGVICFSLAMLWAQWGHLWTSVEVRQGCFCGRAPGRCTEVKRRRSYSCWVWSSHHSTRESPAWTHRWPSVSLCQLLQFSQHLLRMEGMCDPCVRYKESLWPWTLSTVWIFWTFSHNELKSVNVCSLLLLFSFRVSRQLKWTQR